MQKLLITITVLALLQISACSVYKLDIQQGNHFSDTMVGKLKPGMTRKQVRFIMGTPAISDPFHPNRWDYISTNQKAGGDIQKRHLIVTFDGDTLLRIEKRPDEILE